MHQAFLAAVALVALALAGCSGGDDHATAEPVTCPDGTVLSAQDIENHTDHHAEGFDPLTTCPVKPSVQLDGVPASVEAFRKAAFSWHLSNGTDDHHHSMLTSIRYSESSVPDDQLTALSKYPTEIIKREHQDIPITYRGNLTFSKVGTVYVRAYMEFGGKDFWSDEVAVQVTPVTPTGTVHTITVPAGAGVAGNPAPETVVAVLGDALQLANEDLVTTECEYVAGPNPTDPVTADTPVLLLAPGPYEYRCDSVQPTTFKVQVTVE